MLFVVCFSQVISGCWLFVSEKAPSRPSLDHHHDDLPATSKELLAFYQENSHADSSIDRLELAVSALEKLLGMLPVEDVSEMEVQWRVARASFLACEKERDVTQKMVWIARGEDAAETAVRERPNRVEGFYYLAVLKGRRAQHSGIGFSAMMLAKKVEELGLKAEELSPAFENGGPYRLLAMLYAKAPPWPTSIGDIDLAIEYADKAVELSEYPMNHLVKAEVLIEDDEYSEARSELKKVLAAPKVGRWAHEGEQWRPWASKLLKKIEEE